jgi:hypothetical protein
MNCDVARPVPSSLFKEIEAGRLASYHKVLRETAALDRRADLLARRAELSAWKAMVKSTRTNDRRRGG